MNLCNKSVKSVNKCNLIILGLSKPQFSTTNAHFLKEIVKTVSPDGKTTTIEGVHVKSPREKHLLDYSKLPNSKCNELSSDGNKNGCSLCKLGLPIKHTDVLILQQFLDPNAKQLERSVTGLCSDQHRRVGYLIQMAKFAGILKTPADPEPTKRLGYMKYNKYYDESVIDDFFARKKKRHY